MKFRLKTALLAVIVAGIATAAVAQTDAIKTRQAHMKAIGGSVGALVKMVKGETPFDSAAAKKAVETIVANAKDYDTLFPAGSDVGETAAKATIWSDTAGFKAALVKLQTAATANVDVAAKDLDGVKAAVGAIGGTCKGCHDTYRVNKS